MSLKHECKDWDDPTSKPLPIYGGEWRILIVYDTHKTTMVQIKFCPHCGLELPNACGCCEGTGEYRTSKGEAHLCEVCHGSGEEQG